MEALIYITAFVLTMFVAYLGEKRTSVQPSRDEEEFNGRIIAVATALVLFIGFELLYRYLFISFIIK